VAVEFNLFQPFSSEPQRQDDGLDLFAPPPGAAQEPAPERPAAPSQARREPELDLFAPPPSAPPRRPSRAPEPAEAQPEPEPELDLFAPPPSAPSRAPERPPAAPQAPAPPAAPSDDLDLFAPPPGVPRRPAPQRPRRPRREPARFENEDLFQVFLNEKHQGGRELVEHPDPVQRRRRRNRAEPRIRFNTAMNYENFRNTIGREYEAWKQQRQQQQQQQPQPVGRLEPGSQVQSLDQLSEGMVLKSEAGTPQNIRVVSVDDHVVRFQWKKDDGSWSSRTRTSGAENFLRRNYVLQEREEEAQPRAQVGERVQSLDRLRVGDVIQSDRQNAPRRRIVEISGNNVRTENLDEDGGLIGRSHISGSQIENHKIIEQADEGPRVSVGDNIDDTNQLRAGDVISNNVLRNHGTVRKVLEVLPNGDLKTQRVNARNGSPMEDPQTTPRLQIQRSGPYSNYGQYRREPNPDEEQQRQEQQRQEQQRQEQQRQEQQRQEQQRQEQQPHVPVGEPITLPGALRVGDTFRNDYLKGSSLYREVVEIRPDGTVMARLMHESGRQRAGPEPFTAASIRNHGPYKRFIGPGHTVSSPSDVGPGTYVKKGDNLYRVVHRTKTQFQIQDVHEGRGVGRPTRVRKADLEGGEYKIALSPEGAETGQRVTSFARLREGQVVKAMHYRNPKWVRVESIGDKLKIQPINAETGNPEGEPEELSKTDLKRWAYLTKTGSLPEALLPPLEEPPGGFAEPGKGELSPNMQSGRYDDVRISVTGGNDGTLRRLLNLPADGPKPRHVIADLSGAGGLAKSLKSLSIKVRGSEVTVTGAGDHINSMRRYISFQDRSPYSISNSHFTLRSSAPPSMGLKMFATQVAAANKYGFKHINVSAAGHGPWRNDQYNGYYVWPRFGYDGNFPSSKFERMPEEIQNQIRQIRPEAPNGLRFLDVMMASQEARDWWKDRGSRSDLSFDLDSDSRSFKYLTEYVRDVAKKKANVGADKFLNRAAAKKDQKDQHEWYPTFGPEEEEISDEIWDKMGEEVRETNEKKERKKKAATYLLDLAGEVPQFRALLLKELVKEKG